MRSSPNSQPPHRLLPAPPLSLTLKLGFFQTVHPKPHTDICDFSTVSLVESIEPRHVIRGMWSANYKSRTPTPVDALLHEMLDAIDATRWDNYSHKRPWSITTIFSPIDLGIAPSYKSLDDLRDSLRIRLNVSDHNIVRGYPGMTDHPVTITTDVPTPLLDYIAKAQRKSLGAFGIHHCWVSDNDHIPTRIVTDDDICDSIGNIKKNVRRRKHPVVLKTVS